MVDSLCLVQADGNSDLGIDKADIALGPTIESGLVAELVVDTHQPSVFVYGCLYRVREGLNVSGKIVGIQGFVPKFSRRQGAEVAIGKNNFRSAASDGPCRGTPRKT